MTLEKQFTLEAAEKPKTTNPVHQRRLKFTTTIDKQVANLQAGSTGGRGGWVWQSEKGEWFVSPKYGRTSIELAPGLNSIKCSGSDDAIKNLAKLKTMTSEGKLDRVLEAAAAEIRSRFGK